MNTLDYSLYSTASKHILFCELNNVSRSLLRERQWEFTRQSYNCMFGERISYLETEVILVKIFRLDLLKKTLDTTQFHKLPSKTLHAIRAASL